MTDLTKKIADARRLDAEATGAPWRCESFHDQWCEVRHGHGLHNRMVMDCALGKDGEFIAHARNHHMVLWDLVEAAYEVSESIPASHDERDPMVRRHARALNSLRAVAAFAAGEWPMQALLSPKPLKAVVVY